MNGKRRATMRKFWPTAGVLLLVLCGCHAADKDPNCLPNDGGAPGSPCVAQRF
jgi:hypothetical protein